MEIGSNAELQSELSEILESFGIPHPDRDVGKVHVIPITILSVRLDLKFFYEEADRGTTKFDLNVLVMQWNLMPLLRTHTKSQTCRSEAVKTSVCFSRCKEARTSSRVKMDVSFGDGINSSTLRLGLSADCAREVTYRAVQVTV
uniref:AlNc14C292G10253 protein n=1 Tax=Albugo laibachii Nc14 TaxID=890382 RepID=F0WVA8_9STRA|nr:AlNc14C292G10253 [Albugo laibachii Nc14]|eukprot:CCA25347.1 AlNc14C292G10253 [Albugo laibachii Nc14]